MLSLEVCGAVRPLYGSLCVEGFKVGASSWEMYKIPVHTCTQGSVTYKTGIVYPCAG